LKRAKPAYNHCVRHKRVVIIIEQNKVVTKALGRCFPSAERVDANKKPKIKIIYCIFLTTEKNIDNK
jgi:hypothetical protein